MSDKLLVRNVPPAVRSWIEREREQLCVSQQEFVLALLKASHERALAEHLPLLAAGSEPAPQPEIDHTPSACRSSSSTSSPASAAFAPRSRGWAASASSRASGTVTRRRRTARGSATRRTATSARSSPADIPDHDVLAAGFPCQPFSIAGVSKKNSLGRAARLQVRHAGQPVLPPRDHCRGQAAAGPVAREREEPPLARSRRTWAVIRETLTDLDYVVFHSVIDAAGWVPQHRERIYIVGFDRRVFGDAPPFTFPASRRSVVSPTLADILEPDPDPRYTLSDHLWSYLQALREEAPGEGQRLRLRPGEAAMASRGR